MIKNLDFCLFLGVQVVKNFDFCLFVWVQVIENRDFCSFAGVQVIENRFSTPPPAVFRPTEPADGQQGGGLRKMASSGGRSRGKLYLC